MLMEWITQVLLRVYNDLWIDPTLVTNVTVSANYRLEIHYRKPDGETYYWWQYHSLESAVADAQVICEAINRAQDVPIVNGKIAKFAPLQVGGVTIHSDETGRIYDNMV